MFFFLALKGDKRQFGGCETNNELVDTIKLCCDDGK